MSSYLTDTHRRAVRTTAPATTPISVAEAKTRLRIAGSGDDTDIGLMIDEAVEVAESYTGRKFIEQEWTYYFDDFPDEFEIPAGPVMGEVSGGVIQYDTGTSLPVGTSTMADGTDVQIDLYSTPCRICLYNGTDWPTDLTTVEGHRNGIRVRLKLGYGAAASAIPEQIRSGLFVLVDALYNGSMPEDGSLPPAARALLSPYKYFW